MPEQIDAVIKTNDGHTRWRAVPQSALKLFRLSCLAEPVTAAHSVLYTL